MIYTAEIDGKSILDPSNDITLGSPVLELADNTAGSFSFDVYRDNPLYETIADRGQQVITVKRDSSDLWKGRILSTETGFDGTISVTAEGELGYLDDTIQRPAEYHNETVRSFLTKLINAHNSKAGSDKQITDGRVIFSVAMPASMCTEKGTVSVGIRAYDAEERCWMTGYGTMNLQDSLDVTDITAEDPRYTLLEEVMARLGMSGDDMGGFLKKSEADATYYKKTEPIVLTDAQKAELKGEPGAKGDPGVQGIQGPKGDPGPQGEPGADGQDGVSRFPEQSMTVSGDIVLEPDLEYHLGTVTGEHALTWNGGERAQYHFFMATGETAPTISFPATTKFKNADFTLEANFVYEFDAWESDGYVLVVAGKFS